MAMAKKQGTSPLVWAFLLLVLASFFSLIVFLDQRIGRGGSERTPVSESSPEKKPVIDFYDVLPDRKIEIPISDEDREAIENPSINKQAVTRVILRAGAFQSAADAETMKARLAFLGLEAKVQVAELEAGTWHRVQLGPFASNSELSRAEKLLLGNGIKYYQVEVPQ
ncbi:MAG: SPOR domain-containing protein [Gammaproteobacteria bacterium]|nr:SPOR domain-containing protein [Gammaproteobacteria bacterium]